MARGSRAFQKIMRKPAGPVANNSEKQIRRLEFVDNVEECLQRHPTAVLTLGGIEAECVKLFRQRWPRCIIDSDEKHGTTARFTNALKYGRLIDEVDGKPDPNGRTVSNTVTSGTLEARAKGFVPVTEIKLLKQAPKCRCPACFVEFNRGLSTQKVFKQAYPETVYDAMFIDTSMSHHNAYDRDVAVEVIQKCAAEHAVVGITVVARVEGDQKSAGEIAADFEALLGKSARRILAVDYTTNVPMAFCMFEIRRTMSRQR